MAAEGGDGVELGVGADECGRLACNDVAQHAAADGRRDAEDGGRDWCQAVLERLDGAGYAEEPQAGCVEDEQGPHEPLELGMGHERDGGRRQRHGEVLPLGEGGRRRVAEDEVAQDPAAERGDHRQDRDPDDVKVAADRHQRTGNPEREDADQVELGVHAKVRGPAPPCPSAMADGLRRTPPPVSAGAHAVGGRCCALSWRRARAQCRRWRGRRRR